jgi:nitrate reductase NapAB chaperone NapD
VAPTSAAGESAESAARSQLAEGATAMMISGVLVVAKPAHQEEVRAALAVLPWAEVHHAQPDGRLVITIEAEDGEQATRRLREVQDLPQVMLAEMVQHYVESDPER